MRSQGLLKLLSVAKRLPCPSAARFLYAGTTESSSAESSASSSSSSSSPSPFPETSTTSSSPVLAESVTEKASERVAPSESSASAQESVSHRKQKPFWTILKAASAGAAVLAMAGAGYVSYKYTAEEIRAKVSALENVETRAPMDDGSLMQNVENILHSATTKAVAGVTGLYLEIRKAVEDQIKGFAAPTSDKLLPDLLPQERHVFTIVLDVNEMLVYSDWKRDRGWRTFKRPGVEAFLEHLAQYYELVVYTDQLPFVVDPILEKLDQKGCIRYRLAREATNYINGKHYRDLSKLNRDPAKVMYVSAHAIESCLQPENAVPVKPWKLENDDTTLLDLLPFFEYIARHRPTDIRTVLASYKGHDIPSEFRERTKEYQRKMQELRFQNPFFKASRSS